MKIKTNVTLYICEHCGKKMFRKYAMEQHEKWCSLNPENRRACEGCEHLQETTIEVSYGHYDGSVTYHNAKAFRCTKLDKLLYPLKVEQRGLLEKYPETFEDQQPMPKTCEYKTNTADYYNDVF